MKQILFTLLFAAISYCATAQVWLDAGVKAGYGASFLYNKNILDDRKYSPLYSGGFNIGAKMGINFGKLHGITVDGMYGSQKQKYTYLINQESFTNDIDWTTLNLYLMYRFSSQGNTYVEIGPMISQVQKVRQNDQSTQTIDAAEFYTNQYLSGVFGLGGYMAGEDNFSVIAGLRLHYGLDDFVSEAGMAGGYPNPIRENTYETYNETTPIFVEVIVEFNFGIGYFAKTTCGGRRKFFNGN